MPLKVIYLIRQIKYDFYIEFFFRRVKTIMAETTVLFCISGAILAGLLMSRLSKLVGLPAVTAYIVAGILIGPFVLGRLNIEGIGFVSAENIEHFKIISDVALGFIAFTIGNEFRLSQLKQIGGKATFIGIWQAIVTTVVVDVALIALHFAMPEKLPISMAIILGAIATATAPAATLMVVKQYKAKGKLTDLLLPIVAIDDAVGLMVFSISFGVAVALESGNFSIIGVLINPIIEVVASLLLGAVVGGIFTLMERLFSSNSRRLSLSIMFVFLTVALSQLEAEIGTSGLKIGFSSLLTCMMLGTMFCNFCDFSPEIMDKTDRWSQPVLVLFFVISGAELNFSVFRDSTVIIIGLVYILTRTIGKYIGAFSSAKISKCEPKIQKYLGITLFPQAGVALGMSLVVESSVAMGDIGKTIRSITLFAVLIYELISPMMTKKALIAAGDISAKPEHKDRKNKQAPAKI